MSINLFSSFLVYFLTIDPSFFLGRWKLEKHGPINSLLQSEVLAASDLDDQIAIQNAANLDLENHYLELEKIRSFGQMLNLVMLELLKRLENGT
ncbi:hypothetical protein SAMN03080617_01299 [Algoriphagus alkaliphilus]|uniref:Uncharacterized protein n=1 Tax=Algoriphagus alkaliphilus TaxID=279824 RepID=A0A1G5WSR7_9BACT|nr:hypothetical protein [Algoriphagus alkaliphilus]MBA4301027.1 hypothetical protein [Cyclobacterium sp.]SDA60970.1 hypothetical protein SAMN03080617_01299 [Algoriphagus alkaliphilus]